MPCPLVHGGGWSCAVGPDICLSVPIGSWERGGKDSVRAQRNRGEDLKLRKVRLMGVRKWTLSRTGALPQLAGIEDSGHNDPHRSKIRLESFSVTHIQLTNHSGCQPPRKLEFLISAHI